MKSLLLIVPVAAGLSLAQPLAGFNDDLNETARQLTSLHEIGRSVVGSLKARGRSDDEIVAVLDYVLAHPESFPNHSSEHVAGAFGLLNTTNALTRLEQLIDSTNWSVRAEATLAYRDLMFNSEWADESTMDRLTRTVNGSLNHGAEVRNWIYKGFDSELLHARPSPDRRRILLRFFLGQVRIDSENGKHLDEILCREIPKWRGSPQRAENAARMIREHPDSARLVAFFQTVRTNAIESARPAPFPDSGDDNAPTATNRTAFVSPPPETGDSSTGSDPWDDLLENLPERKPGTPTPDSEPPF